jgi:hypothetical protein
MIIHAENQGTKVEMFLSIQMSSAVHIFITPAASWGDEKIAQITAAT